MRLPAFIRSLFYGNYFYGLCAVALTIEATLQQRMPLNGWAYHLVVGLSTVIFYTHAYRSHVQLTGVDERAAWYARHHAMIRATQVLLSLVVLLIIAVALWYHPAFLRQVTLAHAVLFAVFPLVGAAYYGAGARGLRRVGWLKPFVIGWVWAGAVTVYPVLFRTAADGGPFPFAVIGLLLFIKNMMYIAVIGILFDIKDHRADGQQHLRTFVVQRGLRSTLFRLVLPVCALGLGTFVLYGSTHGFSTVKLLMNTVPFLLMIGVAYALRKRRSILYYLVVVDGLLLVKAACGSIGMAYF